MFFGFLTYINNVLTILKVVPGGQAWNSGKLKMGDRILKVNSKDLDGCTHQEAVMGLLEPQDTITLSIQHDPLPDGYKVNFL